jgi:hypothetical protein
VTEIKSRATTYRGIKMRSRLEADYAGHLDREGVYSWGYEPECFAGPGGQWLPDFGLTGGVIGGRTYVEVKPESLQDIDPVLRQMEVAWLSEPAAGLRLVLWRYGGRREDCVTFEGTWCADPGDEIQGAWWTYGLGDASAVWPGMGQLRMAAEEQAGEWWESVRVRQELRALRAREVVPAD